MKEKLQCLFSSLMAILLLASTTSWTVSKHYCMGHLMDVSWFVHAEDCGMDMEIADNATSQLETEDSCCDDEIIAVEGQDDLKLSFENIGLDQQPLLVALAYSYHTLYETATERLILNEHYPPPLLIKNIQLLGEVFII